MVSARALISRGPAEADLYQCGRNPHRIAPRWRTPSPLVTTCTCVVGQTLKLGTVGRSLAGEASKSWAIASSGRVMAKRPHMGPRLGAARGLGKQPRIPKLAPSGQRPVKRLPDSAELHRVKAGTCGDISQAVPPVDFGDQRCRGSGNGQRDLFVTLIDRDAPLLSDKSREFSRIDPADMRNQPHIAP